MTREPVLVAGGAASVVALVMAALVMANSLGWLRLTEEQMNAIESFLLPLVAVVGPLVAAWWARGRTTPTADPKTPDGQPAMIVPVAQAQALGLTLAQWDESEPLPTGYGRKVQP